MTRVVQVSSSAGASLVQPSVHFNGLGDLKPRDDVTPLEAVHLSIMMACASVSSLRSFDFVGYARQHGLGRHFVDR